MPPTQPIETVYLLTGPSDFDYSTLIGPLAFVILFCSVMFMSKNFPRALAYFLGSAMIVIALIMITVSLNDILVRYPRVIEAYRAHRYQVVDGCLQAFVPSPIPGHSPDTIRVGGREFSYDDYVEVIGFHQTENGGGPIHADTWVRLFLVGDAIVRVDAVQKACPTAPPTLATPGGPATPT